MIRQNQGKINIIIASFDIAIAVACVYLGLFILRLLDPENFSGYRGGTGFVIYLFVIAGVHFLCYYRFRFYKSHRAVKFLNEWQQISKACFLAFVISQICVFIFFRDNGMYEITASFGMINYWMITIYKYSVRLILKFLRSKGYNIKYLLIIGKNQCTENFIEKVEQQRGFGYKIAGILGDDSFENIPFLGEIDDIDKCVAETLIDEIIITVADDPELLKKIVDRCNYHGIKFTIMLDIFYIFNDKFYVYEFDNMLSVSTYNIPLEGTLNYMTKRAFDIIVSLICMIILSPLMLAVTIIIKATSRGGAIYKQTRMGLNRKEFTMYKFRSMKTMKSAKTADSGEMQDAEYKMTEKKDPRVTKIGAFIRKSGIDELPQLYNVIKGDMSLVGPRPELPYHVGHFKDEIPFYMVKHYVKPGISGWAQVNGLRGNTSISERIKYDIYYIENWSLWFDIKILVLTLFKGIFSKNAY